ncbi:hypothetical protein AVEN_170581-1 [Araneus ventricosus]|uniref:Uncharacterized protein n=1 Tax=Araneus ventricosus TaxID=182803 RepID=A0A4Y2MC04_ARAVE|nr:hypothetical protein AVEN_170581-1 [Araneus ventricosus]
MSLAYAEYPLDVRESLAVQIFIDAIGDEVTQLSMRFMDFTDLESAQALKDTGYKGRGQEFVRRAIAKTKVMVDYFRDRMALLEEVKQIVMISQAQLHSRKLKYLLKETACALGGFLL